MAADDFFVDLFETAIGEDEILTEVRIPKHTGWGAHYEKFVRVAHQWPIVAVAATVRAEGGTIAEARVGLTNMGSTPLRARGGRGGAGRAAGHRRRASAPRPRGPPTAPTRRRTSTATPTTGGTSRPCSPGAPCSRRREPDRGSRPTASPSPPRSRRPGRTSRTSPRWRSASRAPRSPRPRATPSRLGEGQARPDRPGLQRLRHLRGEGRGGPPLRGRREGQGQARQRHGGREGHADHGRRRRPADRRRGAHRPRDHRQARAVRPRRHAGRLGQAARPVRGLPGAAARRRRPEAAPDGSAVGRRAGCTGRPPPSRAPRGRAAERRAARATGRRTAGGSGRRRQGTTRSTSAPRCCRCWRRPTGSRSWPSLVVDRGHRDPGRDRQRADRSWASGSGRRRSDASSARGRR